MLDISIIFINFIIIYVSHFVAPFSSILYDWFGGTQKGVWRYISKQISFIVFHILLKEPAESERIIYISTLIKTRLLNNANRSDLALSCNCVVALSPSLCIGKAKQDDNKKHPSKNFHLSTQE